MKGQQPKGNREDPGSGGEPQTFGQCTECGTIYPVQTVRNGELRPVGTDGTCSCGNDEFASPTEE
ncbi:hypothetical protein G9464_04900 [Halostella sp. JP-L12]|uniref:hypothetical protein n=1 Tax=Halostella TaxID=1843185 RepID=UPI000EF7EB59|nr:MULTISPECIES: hypothetical protein [Halostella]NHN46934.1 hypothetical protein [Halostella sp. JP-L12]